MTQRQTCIVTGGAGFIGCAISSALAERFNRVVAFDILHPQIHGTTSRPQMLDKRIELYMADICDPHAWDRLLDTMGSVDTVVHLAAETGTGQSLNESTRHGMTNVVGTTSMLDAFSRHKQIPSQIILASSRAVYGEGAWQAEDRTVFYPGQRSDRQLKSGEWDFPGARALPCEAGNTIPHPTSVYGSTKLAQEHILSAWAQSFGTSIKILRLQNVYGPGQSLINSYTGIVPFFVQLAKQRTAIPLYEDGKIVRDFVYIDDVSDAIVKALDDSSLCLPILDVGTGQATYISVLAEMIAERYGAPYPRVCGRYRNGDVRSAFCLMERTREALVFSPRWQLKDGLSKLCAWIDGAQ